MIVTKLQGGHSNQLFQYATGRCLAMRLGVDLFMDTHWFSTIAEDDTPRVYELDNYRFEQKFIAPEVFTLIGDGPGLSKPRFSFRIRGPRTPSATDSKGIGSTRACSACPTTRTSRAGGKTSAISATSDRPCTKSSSFETPLQAETPSGSGRSGTSSPYRCMCDAATT